MIFFHLQKNEEFIFTAVKIAVNTSIKNKGFNGNATGTNAYYLRYEKTCLRGSRPGPTKTGLYSHRRWLEV